MQKTLDKILDLQKIILFKCIIQTTPELCIINFLVQWYLTDLIQLLIGPLTYRNFREALEHVLTNVLELKSEYTIKKT